MNWYEWIADSLNNKSILIIGEDTKSAVSFVSPFGASIIKTSKISSLSEISDYSFDFVICLDSEYSSSIIDEGKRIAKNRFMCGYKNNSTIYTDLLFSFDELWAGSKDGSNRNLIMEKKFDGYWRHKSGEWLDSFPVVDEAYLVFSLYL